MERVLLWLVVVALAGVATWRHMVLSDQLAQQALRASRAEAELRALLDTLEQRTQQGHEKLQTALETVRSQAETGSSLSKRNRAVLELLYVIRESADGVPTVVTPRNDDAAIGIRN